MRLRLLTTLLLWSIIVATLCFCKLLGGEILLLLVSAGALWELSVLMRKSGLSVHPPALCVALVGVMSGHFWGSPAVASIATSCALILVLATHTNSNGLRVLPAALGAMLIVGLGMGSLWAIATLRLPQSILWVVWVMGVIKLSDGGAYLVGKHLGKHLLLPAVSPKKTWEGALGAIISGFLIGILGAPLFPELWLGPLLGVILALVGAIGDLLESALKRAAGVKDSGMIFPGIGGLLDLCDSVILGAPVAWVAIKFLG